MNGIKGPTNELLCFITVAQIIEIKGMVLRLSILWERGAHFQDLHCDWKKTAQKHASEMWLLTILVPVPQGSSESFPTVTLLSAGDRGSSSHSGLSKTAILHFQEA